MNAATEIIVHKSLRRLGGLVDHHESGVVGSVIHMVLVKKLKEMYSMDEEVSKCKATSQVVEH